MPVYTTNFGELLEPGIRRWYGRTYKEWKEEYSQVFEVETSKKAKEYDHSLTGTGLVPQKPEGQAVTYDTVYQGYKKTYTHLAYGLGIIITREMYEDDLYRQMKGMSKALAKSVRHTIEIEAANVLNRAFNTSYVGSDTKTLIAGWTGSTGNNTAHTTIAGGTFRNSLAVAADLDITSFEQMLIDIATQPIDDRGLKMRVMPEKLIITPSQEWMAQKILRSSQEPDTANNAINPGKGKISYVVMHELTDTDAWFVKTDVPNGLTWFWRRRPEFTRDNDWETENAKYKTTMRFSHGWTDPRCIFGSAGSGS